MKNKIKLFSTLGVLALGVSGLFSCGARRTPTDVDVELPDDDPTSEVTITFWHCLGHDKTNNLQIIVDRFNEEYDGKYYLNLVKLDGDYDSLHDTVRTKLAAGEVPALCMGYPDSFAEYIGDDINYSSILRLGSFIEDPEYGFTQEELNDFIDAYLEEGQHYQFEGAWSLPMYKSTEIMYYNECYFAGDNAQNIAHFSEANVGKELHDQFAALQNAVYSAGSKATPEQLTALREFSIANDGYTYDVPTYWDDMIELGRQMNADRAKEGITGQFVPIGYDSDANLYISQFAQRGIAYTRNDEEANEDTRLHYAFNNTEAREFVTEVTDLIREHVLMTQGSTGKYTNEYFTANQAAMVIGSTGGSSYNVSSNFKVGLSQVPYYPGEDGTQAPKYIMQGPSICFFNNNNNYIHKGAWLFYKMLSDTDYNTSLALENSYDPVRESCYQTEQYENWIALADRDLIYAIPKATLPLHDYYMTSDVFVGSSNARDEIGELTSYIIRQNMTVEQAFSTAYNACISVN